MIAKLDNVEERRAAARERVRKSRLKQGLPENFPDEVLEEVGRLLFEDYAGPTRQQGSGQ